MNVLRVLHLGWHRAWHRQSRADGASDADARDARGRRDKEAVREARAARANAAARLRETSARTPEIMSLGAALRARNNKNNFAALVSESLGRHRQ